MTFGLLLLALSAIQTQPPESAFNGSWLMDLQSSSGSISQERLLLKNGMFSRGDDEPGIAVKTDGVFHKIPTDGYIDAISVTAISRRQICEQDQFKGRIVYSITYTLSADGTMMVERVSDTSKPDPKPILTFTTYQRIGKPDSLITLNGLWRVIGIKTTKAHLTQHIIINGDRISRVGAGGYGYNAIIGGPPVLVKGDAEAGRTAVTMPNSRTIVEHMSLNGVATVETTMTLLANSKTIRVTGTRLTDGTHFGWLMHKQ